MGEEEICVIEPDFTKFLVAESNLSTAIIEERGMLLIITKPHSQSIIYA